MSDDLDLTDQYLQNVRDERPEHLSYDEAVARYEDDDPNEFVANAIDCLAGQDPAEVPEPLRTVLLSWYRGTDNYRDAIEFVQDEAARR